MAARLAPPAVLAAVSEPGGGQLALVCAAGCCVESPTELPLADAMAREVHRRLVADDILASGDCGDPGDLSAVADAVFARHGSQRELIKRLPLRHLRLAQPNEGTLVAAALLLEQAVRFVLTLNYDLSLQNALSLLGARDEVAVVRGPEDYSGLGIANVVFLHRSVDSEPDTWVIRSSALNEEWKDGWQQIAAQVALASPVVVFAGLGTRVGVLEATAAHIREGLGNRIKFIQVDVGQYSDSVYAKLLELDESDYVEIGWCAFMRQLGARLAAEHHHGLENACSSLLDANADWHPEDFGRICQRVAGLGLIGLGAVRARWTSANRKYQPNRKVLPEHIADLLLIVALIERVSTADATIRDDGLVEFWQDQRRIAVVAFGSGLGFQRWSQTARSLQPVEGPQPTFAVAAGFIGAPDLAATPPDIVRGTVVRDIVAGTNTIRVVSADDLRSDPSQLHNLVA
jgi:hypothetical protein